MTVNEGGCLCGALRYRVVGEPVRVTICHCRFCQSVTGGPYFIEPIFPVQAHAITQGEPRGFSWKSKGSGKRVTIHFCTICGGRTHLSFERFPDVVGVFNGTFDNPNWIEIGPDNARHIFTAMGRRGVLVPPGINLFPEHATRPDGTANEPMRLDCVAALDGAGGLSPLR